MVKLIDRLNIKPNPEMGVDEARREVEAIYDAQKEAQLDKMTEEDRKRIKYHNCVALLESVHVNKVDIDDIFSDETREIKEGLLRQLGYEALRVGKGRERGAFCPLSDCKDIRIGLALRDNVKAAERFVEKYEAKYIMNNFINSDF